MPVKTQIVHDSFLGFAGAIIFISLSDAPSVFALNQPTDIRLYYADVRGRGSSTCKSYCNRNQNTEFNLGSGGIDYQVSVTDVSNVTSISIHSGNVGENGPVIVTLSVQLEQLIKANDVQASGTYC